MGIRYFSLIKLGVEYNLLNIMLQSVTEDDVRIINNGEENEQEMLHCNYFTIPTLHKATGLVNDFYYIARHNQEVISELENIEQEIIRDFFNMTHKKLNWIIKEATGLVNDFYYIARHNQEVISELENIEQEIIRDFFNMTHKKLNWIIKESLDQLHKKRLITYHKGKKLTFVRWEYNDNKLKENGKVKGKCTYFSSFATKDQLALIEKCEREGKKLTFVRWEYNDNKLKENGKVKGKCTYFSSFATKDQLALIEKCEREAMKKFNLSHFNYIYGRSSNERKKFFRSVEKRIRNYAINSNNEEIKPLAKLNKYANAYEIYITPKWIMEEANKLEYKIQLAKDDYMKAREDYINVLKSMSEYQLVQTHYDVRQVVNENVIKSLVRNSVARHKKADVESIRAKESYVNSCNKLIENYIQRKNDYKTVRNSLIDRGLIKDSHDMDYNKENVEISLNIQDIA